MPLLLAHVNHWLMWALYGVPIVIVLVASLHSFLVQRREGR
jgi:hypothetical protein